MFKKLGPGFLVTAAFIGPGTIITCASSGIKYGFSIYWALLLGIGITILFQEMAARLAVHYGEGLSETLVKNSSRKSIKLFFQIAIIVSIFIGNAAYESGNLMGATIGLSTLIGHGNEEFIIFILSVLVTIILWIGNYQALERLLVWLVFLMGFVFIVLIILADWSQISLGDLHFSDQTNQSYLFTAVALIGTTVVPYNLFLHSRSIMKKWGLSPSLRIVRFDLLFSIVFGGLISLSILLVFAASKNQISAINGLTDLTNGLELKYGIWARYFVSSGVLIAGLTSSLTAPLAASYAISGLFNLEPKRKKNVELITWILVLLTGLLVGLSGIRPIFLIQLAQFANGLLLPFVAIFLLFALNRRELNELKNGLISNILGGIVVLFLMLLGIKYILISLELW
jgi:manganese transport protein